MVAKGVDKMGRMNEFEDYERDCQERRIKTSSSYTYLETELEKTKEELEKAKEEIEHCRELLKARCKEVNGY
jgi:peptidoglycan hydrolase CwlO-like protein